MAPQPVAMAPQPVAPQPVAPQPMAMSGYPQAAEGIPGAPTLAAFYAGQRFVVNKDRYIIGRGKQSSDLTIKDPNVSRQHAMIEYVNGQYFMVDMGSTNGVEFMQVPGAPGQRIARKAVAEGDVYRICDHEVRFTYRG